MKGYHKHHTDVADRQPFFFSMLFLFLAAMFGLVLSQNLIWMYFFLGDYKCHLFSDDRIYPVLKKL